eukprot:m.204865 g.204865  ORF g.204865 m.204865 type:complete len:161 (-) comp15780_c0_seq17:1049-1531(-)
MVQSEGMYSIGLENMPAFNLSSLNASWQRWKHIYPRMQMWGQMSNWCGDPKRAVPPLKPGEVVGCCTLEQDMHERYISGGLPDWVDEQVKDGYMIGYYARPVSPMITNLTWIKNWMAKLQNNYHGNAQYVDTFGRVQEGSPSQAFETALRNSYLLVIVFV